MTDTEREALCTRIDELCAEVERLHGEIRLNPLECALNEAQAYRNQVDALSTENSKLRELVRMMWKPFCWAQSGYDVCLTDEQDKAIRDIVCELGVNVD